MQPQQLLIDIKSTKNKLVVATAAKPIFAANFYIYYTKGEIKRKICSTAGVAANFK